MPEPKTKVAPKKPTPPKLVNRGGFGLLKKKTGSFPTVEGKRDIPTKNGKKEKGEKEKELPKPVAKHKIAPAIQHLALPVGDLVPDPMNARKHPAENIKAIKESLTAFGQTKPIVVRKDTMVIVAGNGTHRCATELGWTEIAVSLVDMSDAEAAAYGIADNRTAELAKWDGEVLSRLMKVIDAANQVHVGWSADELTVMRAAGELWVPPKAIEDDPNNPDLHVMKLVMSDEQRTLVEIVTKMIRERDGDKKLTESACVLIALNEWLPKPKYETEEDESARTEDEETDTEEVIDETEES